MARDLHEHHHDLAAVVVLLVASVVALATWRDYGVTWDEAVHLEYGRHIHDYFASGFVDRDALSYRIDYLYGGAYDLAGAVVCDLAAPALDPLEAIHLLGLIVGVAGLWGTWRLGRALGGARAGLLAAAAITATSVYWGHMANNPKDLPFAVAHVWALVFLVAAIRAFPRVPPRVAAALAVTAGLAMGVRIAGLLLPCYLVGIAAVWAVAQLRLRGWSASLMAELRRLALTCAAIGAGAWLVMIAAWPWAHAAPLRRPLAALRRMSEFMGHRRDMPFAGETISTYDVDWRYLPHYFGLKLPEFVVVLALLGALVGLASLAARARAVEHLRDKLVLGALLTAALFPFAYAIARGSILYDGLRHFLFEVPVIVAGAAWLVDGALDQARARWGPWPARLAAAAFALACLDQHATMARLHPYEYVYFNRFIGGPAGASGRYDTDYYGAGHAGAAAQLRDELWRREGDRFLHTHYRVGACATSTMTMPELPPNFSFERKRLDFWLGYARGSCLERHGEAPAIVEHGRLGAVLVVGRDLRPEGERGEPSP